MYKSSVKNSDKIYRFYPKQLTDQMMQNKIVSKINQWKLVVHKYRLSTRF
jgi:hypothetical protein